VVDYQADFLWRSETPYCWGTAVTSAIAVVFIPVLFQEFIGRGSGVFQGLAGLSEAVESGFS
jgi:hypothetical protein